MHVSLRGWEFDIGQPVASSNGAAVEVSLPNILRIDRFVFFPGDVNVNLFGSYKNLRAINFGNRPIVNVSYASGGIPGSYDYVDLLTSLVNIPLEVGVTRIQTATAAQAKRPLYFLDNVGVGKYDGYSKFPLNYANQYQPNITYLQEPYVINGYTQISYLQASTNAYILIYFYSQRSLDMARAFSNEKVVQEYGMPKLSFDQEVRLN